ncbi:MAG: putative manganese-dependent inorganic diphosphatase [Methanomicrobiaceae archaeon]|nr:putative manganese-dependent inorganic diphosphatase [Methanomicrobiaceae archaeon]
MKVVYIIGHKKPDTDSICSVIGYAEFLERTGGRTYIPARCGDVSRETSFALERFGADPPLLVESVEPTVSDIPSLYTVHARADLPTIDVVEMMGAQELRNLPIVDDAGRCVGLISEHGLARAYVRRQKIEQLSIAPMKLQTLARVLGGEIRVAARDILEGRVYTAIDALHVTLEKLTPGDVAIVGDNEPAQLALISAGIAAVVIADAAPVGDRVIRAAEERKVSLLSTALDAFGVGKMINLSLPAHQVMDTDVPFVGMEDPLPSVKKIVSGSPYRTACVVDEENRFLGMISRNLFLEEIQKSVILLDHNEYAQAVDGVENAEILEIIDHHRIGAITTLKPISFLNIPLGSTSTIIARRFMDSGEPPTPRTAGLLLSGILSDTLVLRLSTTTPEDRSAAAYCAEIAGVDLLEYGTELVRSGMELDTGTLPAVIRRDVKHYQLFGKRVLISQVLLPSFDYVDVHGEELEEELPLLRREEGADIAVLLCTSVLDEASLVFADGDLALLEHLGLSAQPTRLDGVMSRKKDFLPWFGGSLKGYY